MNKPHKHAQLMLQYAQDAQETERPWERWQAKASVGDWYDMALNPEWLEGAEYRRKPRTININGIEVPEPMRVALEHGTAYYVPEITSITGVKNYSSVWTNDKTDKMWLKLGICHLTRESAELHAKALLSFTKTEETK